LLFEEFPLFSLIYCWLVLVRGAWTAADVCSAPLIFMQSDVRLIGSVLEILSNQYRQWEESDPFKGSRARSTWCHALL